MVKNGIYYGKGSGGKMGGNPEARADSLLGGKNKGGYTLWQILDDSSWRGAAKLG